MKSWMLAAVVLLCASSAQAEVVRYTYSGALIPVPLQVAPAEAVRVRPVTEITPGWFFKNLFRHKTRWVIEPVERVNKQ